MPRNNRWDPALVAICFSYMDKEASDSAVLQKKLKEDMSIIGGLAEEYQILFFINIDESSIKVTFVDDDYKPIVDEFLSGSDKGIDSLKIFGESPFVHPDDRVLFKDFGAKYVREKLKETKKFIIPKKTKLKLLMPLVLLYFICRNA